MQHMRSIIRIGLGVALAVAGVLFLIPTAILLNQRFQFVRVTWGIFDPQVKGASVGTGLVIAMSGSAGAALLVLGFLLARPRHGSGA
jgi:hypothetical protein